MPFDALGAINKKPMLVAGIALGAGALIYAMRDQIGSDVTFVFNATSNAVNTAYQDVSAAVFSASLPRSGKPLADTILRVAREQGLSPYLLAAIIQHESGYGTLLTPKGPGGTGDFGHGHGLMQIDDRTWGDWLASNNWQDPYTNISKGAEIFRSSLSYFQSKGLTGDDLTNAAIAGYNANPAAVWSAIQKGKSPDAVTTGRNYAALVTNIYSNLVSA